MNTRDKIEIKGKSFSEVFKGKKLIFKTTITFKMIFLSTFLKQNHVCSTNVNIPFDRLKPY